MNLGKGQIYLFPNNATVILGQVKGDDLELSGSSVRLRVDGTVKIQGNIVYGSHRAKNYLNVPNLRIEAKRIEIDKDVEYIESQLQADYFATGISSRQLRILGDVIAKETHFQREPTAVSSPEEMENNPPSEMIIEDLRKYLVPAPGDTTLRDSYDMWQQVNPITGEAVDPY